MADSIDLDDVEVDEPEDDGETANYGDWLWRGEGDPEDEPEPQWAGSSPTAAADDGDSDPDATGEEPPTAEGKPTATDDEPTDPDTEAAAAEATGETDATDTDEEPSTDRQPIPKVPGGPSGPVGVPEDRGGSGGGSSSRDAESTLESNQSESSPRTTDHGGGSEADDMTLAMTYEAINRLEDPQFVMSDARGWADWVGIVGKVSTPAIRKFQRDQLIDLDFFGGSDTGPDRRLADITPESMFYAERMVLVGTENDEWIAEAAGWEFVPLETAAEKAGWVIEHAE